MAEWSNASHCKWESRRFKSYPRLYSRTYDSTDMNVNDKGEVAEASIIAHFKQKGYVVSQPFGENSRYDLIVDDGEHLSRVQVKFAWVDEGRVVFNCASNYADGNSTSSKTYTGDEIDRFVAYCHELNTVYSVPVEESPDTRMYLRLPDNELSKFATERNIRWADEYEV